MLFTMKSPQIGPLSTLGGDSYESGLIPGQMKVVTQKDRQTEGETGNNVVKEMKVLIN